MSVHCKTDENDLDYKKYEAELNVLIERTRKDLDEIDIENEYDKQLNAIHRKLMKEMKAIQEKYKQIFTIPYTPEDEEKKNGEKRIDLAKNAYPELEWEVEDGGNFEQFNFVKKVINDDDQKKCANCNNKLNIER